MSLKSLIQAIIILLIITILGGVYINYFSKHNKVSVENVENDEKTFQEETVTSATKIETNELTDKPKIEKNELTDEPNINTKEKQVKSLEKNKIISENKKKEVKLENEDISTKPKKIKPKINNIVKDIEYLTTDKNGNKYKILATSGRTNLEDKNILDLDNVKGIITSDKRSTVYIVSDFAEYNSSNLNSNFYQNVIINYEDKEITCDYFDIDMKTNIAIAYNNVVVTDPQSIMKAGKIILNIETKVININPDYEKNKVKVTIN